MALTSELIEDKIKKSEALWSLPGVVMVITTIQALLRLRQVSLEKVPIIGGLSSFIHSNELLSKAAVIFYQNTAPVALIFLFCTICWIAQGVFTHIYKNKCEERVRYGAFFGLFGAVLFIVLFIAVYVPLLNDPAGFIIEKIIFFGVPIAAVALLAQSFWIFPWKEIVAKEIFEVLTSIKGIIRDTEEKIKTEIGKISAMGIIEAPEISTVRQDIETSCRSLLSEANAKEKETGEKTNISELNNLLIAVNDLHSRAEKNKKRIEDVKNSIREALIRKIDRMYEEVTNLGSEVGCTNGLTLTNLPQYLREVNIPGIGSRGIEEVPNILKSMIKEKEKNIEEFEEVFNVVDKHLADVKKYIGNNKKAIKYEEVMSMVKNTERNILNIPNEIIRKKLKYLFIDSPTKYKGIKIAKGKIEEAKKDVCALQFDEAMYKLKEAEENIKVVNKQINFISAMITAVEDKWDSKRVSESEKDILMDLSEDFRNAYGAKYTTNKNTLNIRNGELKIEYEPISVREEVMSEHAFHPNEVRAILYLLREEIEDKKEATVFLSKDKLPANAKRPEVLKEFKSFVQEVLGEGIKCDTETNFIEIQFEENMDPVDSINKVIEEHEKRW